MESKGEVIAKLAERAAEAMAALGSSSHGTWQERRAALMRAGRDCDSGFDEVIGWFTDE